ncbi:MAG: transglutaminase domain-containing protein [Aristaeellaceae bacterium]
MNKLISLLLACALLLSAAVLPAMAEDTLSADCMEALQAILEQQQTLGAATFQVKCSEELYATISENRFASLYRLCYLAGMKDFGLRYSSSGLIQLENIVWEPDAIVAVCETEADAEAAVAACLQNGGDSVTLLCTAELFQSLYTGRGMFRLMAGLGIADFQLQGNSANICFLSGFQPMTVPYARVNSISQAGEQIALWRESAVPAFNLIFEPSVYEALTRDDYKLIAFLGGTENYSLSYSTGACMLLFTEVTYTGAACLYCESDEEIVQAIRAMGAQGVTSFRIMMDQATYDGVYANSFAHLYELEAQAGMTAGDLRFSSASRLILIDNAVIQSDATPIASLEEACAHVAQCAGRGDTDISLLLTAEVYSALMEGVGSLAASDARFYDLLGNVGIFTADKVATNRFSGSISLQGVHYYAGTDILRAVDSGTTDALPARYQEALTAAQSLAASCARETDTATALAIHDALCELITYTDDDTTVEDDCCVGALLSGRANCDGYADAMVLVGRLAGLNVRYQHGDSLKGGFEGMFSTHMWNLIELDGTWRMIDVTWDDMASDTAHLWFNVGEDRAALSHTWGRDMTVPMLAATDPASRPVYEAFATTAEDATAAAAAAQQAGATVFDLYLTEGSELGQITLRTAMLNGLSGSVQYVWVPSLRCMHVTLLP